MATMHLHGNGEVKARWQDVNGVYWLTIKVDGVEINLCLEAKDANEIANVADQMATAMTGGGSSALIWPEGEPLRPDQVRAALKPGDYVSDYKDEGEVEFPT